MYVFLHLHVASCMWLLAGAFFSLCACMYVCLWEQRFGKCRLPWVELGFGLCYLLGMALPLLFSAYASSVLHPQLNWLLLEVGDSLCFPHVAAFSMWIFHYNWCISWLVLVLLLHLAALFGVGLGCERTMFGALYTTCDLSEFLWRFVCRYLQCLLQKKL